jgi:type II secretion system protein H
MTPLGHQRGVVPMTPRARPGFTLVEMMVVIAILAVMAAVSVPAIRDLRASDPLDQATSVAVTLLSRARQTAVERASLVRVVVDPAGRQYWVRAMRTGSAPDSVMADTLALPPDVTLDATTPRLTITFTQTGEARGDALVLRWQGHTAAIAADQWTGDAHVAQR